MKLMDKEPMLEEINKALDMLKGFDDMAHNVARIQLESMKQRVSQEPEVAGPSALAFLLEEVGAAMYDKGRADAQTHRSPADQKTILEWIRAEEIRETTAQAISPYLYMEYQNGYKRRKR